MHQYQATIVRVIDGDTIVVDLDLGFGVWVRRQTMRLLGCNSWEKHTPAGGAASTNLTTVLPAGTQVQLTSVKVDKWGGRYDAAVLLADGTDLVDTLITQGWAAQWDGTGVKPVPVWPRVGA